MVQAPGPPAHHRRQRGVAKDLRARLELLRRDLAATKPAFQSAKVEARRDKQGRVLVSVTAIPLDDLEEFAAVVRARLIAEGEGGRGLGAWLRAGDATSATKGDLPQPAKRRPPPSPAP